MDKSEIKHIGFRIDRSNAVANLDLRGVLEGKKWDVNAEGVLGDEVHRKVTLPTGMAELDSPTSFSLLFLGGHNFRVPYPEIPLCGSPAEWHATKKIHENTDLVAFVQRQKPRKSKRNLNWC